jgi:hypothetical protein
MFQFLVKEQKMKGKLKGYLGVLVVGVSLILLSGCSSGGNSNDGDLSASGSGSQSGSQSDVIDVPTSIEVDSIERSQIYIQGSGNPETSGITFLVKDSAGDVVSGATIQFSLVGGSTGGEYLVPTSDVTDSDGKVTTTLKAGDQPGAVQIKASYSYAVYTTPPAINIFSGPPEGKHLSMSFEALNILGLLYDGLTDEVTLNLADLYSNPVPDDTAVQFQAEYAKIEGGAGSTTNGVVTADLITQDPKPGNGAPVHIWAQTNSGAYAYISGLHVSGDTIYAATDGGGIFKSTDGGENWANIGRPKSYAEGEQGLWGTYVNDVTVNKTATLNDVMVATEDGGVLYSEDGGYNWVDCGSLSDRYTDYNVADAGSLTYYAINQRSRQSVAAYDNWSISGKTFTCAAGTHDVTYDINYNMPSTPAKIIKKYDDDTYFAHFYGSGLYQYETADKLWTAFNTNLPSTNISTITLVGTDIYVTIGGKVYKSAVAAANFANVGATQPVSFNDAFYLAANTSIYYTGTDEIIRRFDTTTDTFVETISDATSTYPQDIKGVWAVDATTLYAATDYGVYRFENGGTWAAYPLNVYKDVQTPASSTTTLTLSYDSDQDETHTTIYVDGDEMSGTAYSFTNSTTISLTSAIAANSTVEIFYTLKPYASSIYTEAPEEEITALYYDSAKLYFGTENRGLYCLTNPATASNGALPQIKDISGLATKISSVLYETGEIMFSENTQVDLLWDTTGDGNYDNTAINVADSDSQWILVIVSDGNGRSLVAGSKYAATTAVGALAGTLSHTWADSVYGPTQFLIQLYDDDPGNVSAETDLVTITITSDNLNVTYSISATVN